MGACEQIDLFLYTRGGHTLTPNRLVYLLREYCQRLCVLVPHYAHSAGTTLATGANEIVMHRMGELGPTDPSVANPFNPEDPTDPSHQRRLPISVEDVNAYVALIRDHVQVGSEDLAALLDPLTSAVHPLALGNIYRQHLLIRTMGSRLLATHLDPDKDSDRIEKIMEVLTEKLYYHGYPVSRQEARDVVGLPVTFAGPELEADMWALYSEYKRNLKFGQPFIPGPGAIAPTGTPVECDVAVVESNSMLHTCRVQGTARLAKNKGTNLDEVNIEASGAWEKRA